MDLSRRSGSREIPDGEVSTARMPTRGHGNPSSSLLASGRWNMYLSGETPGYLSGQWVPFQKGLLLISTNLHVLAILMVASR